MIGEIKSAWLRRPLVVLTAAAVAPALFVIGAANAIYDDWHDPAGMAALFRQAWRGPSLPPAR